MGDSPSLIKLLPLKVCNRNEKIKILPLDPGRKEIAIREESKRIKEEKYKMVTGGRVFYFLCRVMMDNSTTNDIKIAEMKKASLKERETACRSMIAPGRPPLNKSAL